MSRKRSSAFAKELNIDKSRLEHLNLTTQHRRLFETLSKVEKATLMKGLIEKLRIALEYVKKVILP